MFILGFFWKKTTSNAALFATVGGFILSVIFKFIPSVINLSFLKPLGFATLVKQTDGTMLYEIPFIDRMGFVFAICVIVMYIISKIDQKGGVVTNGLEVDRSMFKLNNSFAVGALIIAGILVALYSFFW
jgi:SSS family solute:Na+ symporter